MTITSDSNVIYRDVFKLTMYLHCRIYCWSYFGVVQLFKNMLYFKMSCMYCCSCVYCCSCLVCIVVVVLCVLLSSYVYLLYYVCIAAFTLDAGLLARSQYSEGPATGHLDTGFSWFPCA